MTETTARTQTTTTPTIAGLAAELGVPPYEVATFARIGTYPQDAPLNDRTADRIRAAWAAGFED